MSPPPAKSRRARRLSWLGGASLCMLAPKCLGCLAAYVGLGTLLGLRTGPELCGRVSTASPAFAASGVLAVSALLVGTRWLRRVGR